MDNVSLGLKIKELRKEKKITQQELADKIGRTESSIRKYEKGLIDIPNSVLSQIATALDTSLQYLIGISDFQIHQESLLNNLMPGDLGSTESARFIYQNSLITLEQMVQAFPEYNDNALNSVSATIETLRSQLPYPGGQYIQNNISLNLSLLCNLFTAIENLSSLDLNINPALNPTEYTSQSLTLMNEINTILHEFIKSKLINYYPKEKSDVDGKNSSTF
nr:helix-turn-helix transcriptional regulator [uncultured Niameybacter sp.]